MELEQLRVAACAASKAEGIARNAYQAAIDKRVEAYRRYNEAAIAARGIEIGKTIITANTWFSEVHRFVVSEGSGKELDALVGREVTSKNVLWKGRNPRTLSFSKIVSVTDEEIESAS